MLMQSIFWIFIFRCLHLAIRSWFKVILCRNGEFKVFFFHNLDLDLGMWSGLMLCSRGVSDYSCYIAVFLPPLHSVLCHRVPSATYPFFLLLIKNQYLLCWIWDWLVFLWTTCKSLRVIKCFWVFSYFPIDMIWLTIYMSGESL